MRLTRKNKRGKAVKSRPRYSPPLLDLAIGSRVAVDMNMAVKLGLYRGALGTVVGFVFEQEAPSDESRIASIQEVAEDDEDREIPVVLVQMDEHYKGPSCIEGVPRIVPFRATPSSSAIQGKYTRYELPLVVAHARTIHKAQGLTAKHGLVIIPETRAPVNLGLYYVAQSRASSACGLFLTSP
mmetsp:Transcript_21643/g.67832  ORF Transcript_21643/g.67832 Transcript_21643/m.67832 type:complete len:183 (+) Transcript_21643:463-1011(+)